MGWGLIVGLSSCVTMMSSSSVGIFSVSVVGDDDDDEVIVSWSLGARFRCTCAGARSTSGLGTFTLFWKVDLQTDECR